MELWEYSIVRAATYKDGEVALLINDVVQDFERTPTRILSLLNQMGSEGWELVVVRAYMPPSSSAVSSRGVWDYVLKRRRQAPIS